MKPTDTQTQILAAASVHPHGLALPPERLSTAPRQMVGKALLKAGLVIAVPEHDADASALWPIDGEGVVLRISDAGRQAIGAGPVAGDCDTSPSAVGVQDAAQEPQGEPLAPPTVGEAQQDATERAGAVQDAARAGPRRRWPSVTLLEAATAVATAWDASPDHPRLEEALATLRSVLAGKPPRSPRQPGKPRKPCKGTKQGQVLALLRRDEGATVVQIIEATGWQSHTVRGFLAGLKKRQGIAVEVLERVRQVGPNKAGAKGSYSVYRIADAG